MEYILSFIIFIHGLIHLLGFVKAFNLAKVDQLKQNISKIAGLFWLISSLLFITTAFVFILNKNYWWLFAVTSMIISQILIIKSLSDAKFGTIANLIVLIALIIVA